MKNKTNNCEKYQEWIIDFLVGELDDKHKDELQIHLENCEHCQQEVNEMQKLLNLTKESLSSNKFTWSDDSINNGAKTVIDIDCLNQIYDEESQNNDHNYRKVFWRYAMPIAASLAILAISADALIAKYRKDSTMGNIMSASTGSKQDFTVMSQNLKLASSCKLLANLNIDINQLNIDTLRAQDINVLVEKLNKQLKSQGNLQIVAFHEQPKDRNLTRSAMPMASVSEAKNEVSVEKISSDSFQDADDGNEKIADTSLKSKAKKQATLAKMEVRKKAKKAQVKFVTLRQLLNKLAAEKNIKWQYDESNNKIILKYEQK
ncbi:zf-HC2 domain-containing protein [Lentisphaerota bacterium WC36G]|nr:zf-HC2 domain-containing protein [Lentisphaerae bacterium WC36]